MDIEGLGDKLVDRFIQEGYLHDPADLYSLKEHRQLMIELERLGEKSVDKVLFKIEESKKRPLSRLIYALGIRQVGERASRLLADRFGSIQALAEADESSLLTVAEIGPSTAAEVRGFFQNNDNLETVAKLVKAGVEPEADTGPRSTAFEGLTFVFTGTLQNMTRDQAEELARRLGGRTSGSVSKQTAYVVAGENSGSKLDKANTLGIKVLTEEEFIKLTTAQVKKEGDEEQPSLF